MTVTSAERAALVAVCQRGATDASAARLLAISERALRARLQRLYRKLDVNSAAQAAYALGIGRQNEHVSQMTHPGSVSSSTS